MLQEIEPPVQEILTLPKDTVNAISQVATELLNSSIEDATTYLISIGANTTTLARTSIPERLGISKNINRASAPDIAAQQTTDVMVNFPQKIINQVKQLQQETNLVHLDQKQMLLKCLEIGMVIQANILQNRIVGLYPGVSISRTGKVTFR